MQTGLTTLDILYISLSVGVIILVIVLAVAIINATLLVKDVRKISKVAGSVTEKVHEMILAPVAIVTKVTEAIVPHIEDMIKKRTKTVEKKARKAKKASSSKSSKGK